MPITGIYQIQSKIKPERIYIGSAMDINHRRRGHLTALKRNKHGNSKLQNHYNKYGKADLQFSILLGCKKKDLIKNEQFFLDSYNPWFNINLFAKSRLGVKISEKTRAKMSAAFKGRTSWNKGKKLSEEHKKKISEANKGKSISIETRRKISKSKKGENHHQYGNPRSEIVRRKISETKKGRHPSKETRKKMSEAQKNRSPISEETRQKIRDSWVIRKLNKVA